MMRPLDYPDLITGGDVPLDDDSQVCPGSQCLGKSAWKLRIIHARAEPPARNPWFGYFKDKGSNRPTLADERIVYRDSFSRQVFSELAVLKRAAECFFPPAQIFDGIGVERLVRTAVGFTIRLIVSFEIYPACYDAAGHRRFPNRALGWAAVKFKLSLSPHIH